MASTPEQPYDGLETPEADAAEQRAELVEVDPDDPADGSDEVDPADREEQRRVVPDGDDDYR